MGNLIIKDNALIEASHKLGEVEQRLILLAILKARSQCSTIEQLKGKELVIHADDYIKTFNVDKSTAYKVLRKAVLSLFRAEWGYKFVNEKGLTQVAYRRFIQSADYVDDVATVYFKFADDTVPMLVELERRFTVYEIEQVANLSSQYAMRLYEFFVQHLDKKSGKGWLDISLENLRFRFGLLPTEYKTMSNFKTRVLDYSINEINKKTDLTATYEQRKKGRVITGFRFEFTKKQQQQPEKVPELPKATPEPDLFADFSDVERKAIQARIDEYIKRQEQKGELISDFYRSNITKKAIAERWGLDILVKQQEKAKIEKAERERKKAEEQAEQARKEKERQQIEEQRQFVIEQFEILSPEQQENVINEIFEQVGKGAFKQIFQTARQQGTVHTDARFVKNFYDLLKKERIRNELAEHHAKIEKQLALVCVMPDGQLFQASDQTVYEKRGDSFFSVTRPEDTRPRSLYDAASCWVVDSWKPIDKMPEPPEPSRIFKHYATEEDILSDRAKGLNPWDYLTDDEKKEVNEIIQEYQENKDPEIYEFIVNILGIQLDEPKKPSLMARLKRQN